MTRARPRGAPAAIRCAGLALASQVLAGGCAAAPPARPAPRGYAAPPSPVAVVVVYPAGSGDGEGVGGAPGAAAARLRGRITAHLLEVGAAEVREPLAEPLEGTDAVDQALAIAREIGASTLCVIELDGVDIARGRHHINEYFDASVSARAQLVAVADGALLGRAAESARASRREDHARWREAVDLACDRLALRLARGLLALPAP